MDRVLFETAQDRATTGSFQSLQIPSQGVRAVRLNGARVRTHRRCLGFCSYRKRLASSAA